MAYYLNLFSPETYEAYKHSDQNVSGFRMRQENAAGRIKHGDKLLCYLTRLGRWFGVLEVQSGPFIDKKPIFYPEDDPFVLRFSVTPIVVLDVNKAVPIREGMLWEKLSFTKGHNKGASTWTGKIRASLTPIDEPDGQLIESLLKEQADGGSLYEFNAEGYAKLVG
jgi:predicted RNA-binding protein